LTNPQFFLGTLAYAAPEQMRGEEVSTAADVYALGVIAYEMLTGGRPFDASNQATLINKSLNEQPTRASARGSNLPQAMDDAVMKALNKEIADRWPSVTAFIEALRTAVGQAPQPTGATVIEAGLLARYELGPMLGRGRLGSIVFQGTHRALGVPVAIRVLKRDEQPHWDVVRARFLLEARTLQVSHKSVLQVRDFGEDDRGVYLVTDLIDGPSLRQAMAETGAFPWPRTKNLVTQALEAMSALHAKGGYICGVNPDMIRLRALADQSAEEIVISSAGIKSVKDVIATMREQELRGQEASANELPYMAPEILMGGAPNPRADIFTIGVLAYQMVTGLMPFKADSLPELIGQMLQTKPAAPQGDIPDAARDAILKAIDSTPLNRFESADAFARALA
jgi:serine/threonine-protein kinase